MSHIDTIASTIRQTGIDQTVGAGSAVRRGWDYWIPGEHLTDGEGAARIPHRFLRRTLPNGAMWIIRPDMSDRALMAGIWRQCLIRPGDLRAANHTDPFAVSSLAAQCTRDEYMIALLGHTPLDLVLWLVDLRSRDRTAFELVLAKDFRGALAYRPDLILDSWPASATTRWTSIARDYLPPLLAAVLYAELARLAVNQAGLIELSFDAAVELTTTQFLDRVPLAAHEGAPIAISRAIGMLPFQSVALTPPDTVLLNVDRLTGADWSRTAAASLARAVGENGNINIAPADPRQAKDLRDNYAASPAFWSEQRIGHGYSRQPRPAATLWGLNWRRHAAVGLLEIARQAQRWNRELRLGSTALSALPKRRRAQAILAISTSWLAETNPEAGLAELQKISPEGGAGLTTATVDPLSVDAMITPKSGEGLLAIAEERIKRRPGRGELGYTARYLPQRWLDDDGDDLAHYLDYQMQAVREHGEALNGVLPSSLQELARVDPKVVALLGRQHGVSPKHGDIGHNRPPPSMTADPTAACAAQLLGQAISPLSTSSIIEVLRGRK